MVEVVKIEEESSEDLGSPSMIPVGAKTSAIGEIRQASIV